MANKEGKGQLSVIISRKHESETHQTTQATPSCEWKRPQRTRTQRRPKALQRMREHELLERATTRPEASTRAMICRWTVE